MRTLISVEHVRTFMSDCVRTTTQFPIIKIAEAFMNVFVRTTKS